MNRLYTCSLLTGLVALLPNTQIKTTDGAIQLESTVIRILDGCPIDGPTLWDCACMIREMRKMVYGKIIDATTKERQGLYLFRGQKYGLAMLCNLEKQYVHDKEAQQELNSILHSAKKEFSALSKPFLNNVQSSKSLVMKLMVESCTKRNVPNSFMLRWADTPEGQEEESFERQMTTCTEFTKFLNELCNFMSDIFHSCPKARKQYEELVKKYKG